MRHQRALIALLSDGRFHSGEALGAALGVSRAQIWQVIKSLKEYGIGVESVRGQGYRITSQISLLDADYIRDNLSPDTKLSLSALDVFFTIDSTSAYLMTKAKEGAPSGTVCLAEHQSAGTGRRGRKWISPLGSNLYCSLLWRLPDGIAGLGGLSLIMAIATIEALEGLGVTGLSVKWPNDIVSSHGKVGGILLEVAGEQNGPCYVVVGIGLNIGMSQALGECIEQAWSNISSQEKGPSRNEVAVALVDQLFRGLQRFEAEGPSHFLQQWHKYDFTRGKEVNVHLHDRIVCGVAQGIDERGFLIVAHEDRLAHYCSGEVSLRVATDHDSTD